MTPLIVTLLAILVLVAGFYGNSYIKKELRKALHPANQLRYALTGVPPTLPSKSLTVAVLSAPWVAVVILLVGVWL